MIEKHAQAILSSVVKLESIAGTPPTVVTPTDCAHGIPMSTMLIDVDDTEVISLGKLMYKCAALENQVEMLRASICVQGGVTFVPH